MFDIALSGRAAPVLNLVNDKETMQVACTVTETPNDTLAVAATAV
jgi:hypothetical protein